MEMHQGSELAWFRAELWRSIVRPREFAQALAREHYGLAGVLVALIAGIALSLGIDLLVLASKGISATGLVGRLLTDATFLAVRLAVTAAAVSWLTVGALRVTRRRWVTLDQLFTAVTFALAPLVFAPACEAVVTVASTTETLMAGAVVILLLVARVVVGVALNIRALLPPGHAAITFVLVVALAIPVLGDQVARMRFVTYAAVPALVSDLAVAPPTGERYEMIGFDITLPTGWRNASTGNAGEAARFESSAATVTIARAAASPVDTADRYADNIARQERLGVTDVWQERGVTRIDGIVAVDDRYGGRYDGRAVLWRQFTIAPGAQGLALVYRAVAPADPDAALAEAAAIAASWRIRSAARSAGAGSHRAAGTRQDGEASGSGISVTPPSAPMRKARTSASGVRSDTSTYAASG